MLASKDLLCLSAKEWTRNGPRLVLAVQWNAKAMAEPMQNVLQSRKSLSLMSSKLILEDLWEAAPIANELFQPIDIESQPEPVRRYLAHAIAPGTPLASAVRLQMHGEIKLRSWINFTAEQVIRPNCAQMVWRARVRKGPIWISGHDMIAKGEGSMLWKLFGIFPVMSASGRDVTRSAEGRIAAECVWLPTMLCGKGVAWTTPRDDSAVARFKVGGSENELALQLDSIGSVKTVSVGRWGTPEGHEFRMAPFGGVAEEERAFGGITIPTQLRIGWNSAKGEFATDGESFRVQVDNVIFR